MAGSGFSQVLARFSPAVPPFLLTPFPFGRVSDQEGNRRFLKFHDFEVRLCRSRLVGDLAVSIDGLGSSQVVVLSSNLSCVDQLCSWPPRCRGNLRSVEDICASFSAHVYVSIGTPPYYLF